MKLTEQEIKKIQNTAVRNYLKSILLKFHENRMDGKGFDFFFVLSNDLEDLTNNK
jgi:hypothetical protein